MNIYVYQQSQYREALPTKSWLFDRLRKSASRPKSRGLVYRRLIFPEASSILRLSVSPGQLDLLQDVF